MSALRIIYILLIIFSIRNALAADSVQLPSNYSVNATDWVTIADSGTTPAISGFTNAFVIVSTTAGNIKITTTTGLSAINGFCGYDETNEKTASNYLNGDEPSDCNGSSLTELGFAGTQAEVNTALATLQLKGSNPTITIKAYEAGSGGNDSVHYNKDNGHFYKVVNSDNLDASDENLSLSGGAQAAARASTYAGMSGYLAYITSEAENEFIFYLFNNHDTEPSGNAYLWIGANDIDDGAGKSGIWRWNSGDGPSSDLDKIFFCDSSGGGEVDGAYSCTVDSGFSYNNWCPSGCGSAQPDDDGDGDNNQQWAVMVHNATGPGGSVGAWGDTVFTHNNADHYVIEYNHEDSLDTN